MTQYGKFHNFCRDSGNRYATIPVCNFFNESPSRTGPTASGFGGCDLLGINLSNGRQLANLGSILLSFIAILVALALILRTHIKRAAVGRREMQLFLLGYAIVSLCEIFSVGGFPLNESARRGFSAVHIAAVVGTAWTLLMNAVVGFQIVEDGTIASLGGIVISSLILTVGTGYIAFDTGFSFTNYFKGSLDGDNQNYWLYTLYLLVPLICIVLFYVLELFLVLRVLAEIRPLIWLTLSGLLFAVGQIFQFVASNHICSGTNHKINGGFFEVLFTLASVVTVWIFWSSITEDDWEPGYA